jgi:hypothetical protein
MASVVINTRFNNRKAEADLKELQAEGFCPCNWIASSAFNLPPA